jgi:membrane protease YdiL (CAAX protease family)
MTELQPEPIPRTTRLPNFFHFLLFLTLTVFALLVVESAVALAYGHAWQTALADQRLQTLSEMAAYVLTLAAASFLFPLLWRRSFLDGIAWNPTRKLVLLIPAGIVLGYAIQAADSLLPVPADAPIEEMFKTPGIIWLLTFFGVLLAPLFEEILFRGFLLPAVAIFFDYVSLPRSPDPAESLATLDRWRTSEAFSGQALAFSSIVVSILFAGVHAPQLGFSWPSVGLLLVVSLVLCFVRIRLKSVAASTILHASYNFSVFLTLFYQTGGYRHLDRAF